MKILGDLYHFPSQSKYLLGRLTEPDEKNRAYPILYKRYIGEARKPWNIDPKNPSGLRVEEREIDGRKQKVLVDDWEHVAVLGGIKCAKTGKLLSTACIIPRHGSHKISGMLEIERYSSLPKSFRASIRSCDAEANRMANEVGFSKKRTILLHYCKLLNDINATKTIYTVFPEFVEKVPFAKYLVLGTFKFNQDDKNEASVGIASMTSVYITSHLYAATALTFYMKTNASTIFPLTMYYLIIILLVLGTIAVAAQLS
ncbi:hypothetical protein ACA910_011381 [Epithemia clementina (nom. ined.)]